MENKVIDLNFNLLELTGAVSDSNAGKLLASILASETKHDSLKLYSWALKFFAGEGISLDLSDYDFLKKYIAATEKLPAITKAQILQKFL